VIIVGSNVVRVSGLLVLRLMTLIAIVIHQLIVSIHMTRLTLSCYVSTGEREPRCGMVECRVLPIHRRVTLGTVVVELASYVIGIRCSIEVGCMTIPACHRQILIHVVDVATVTGHGLMGTGERKPSCCVIECRRSPY
jgi:hypothetical protein